MADLAFDDDRPRWFVVETQPRAEATALRNLARQGFDAYCPKIWKRRRHARRVEDVQVPFFPGYLFVLLDIARQHWRPIRSTFGVRRLVQFSDRPTPVPEGLIEMIKAREAPDGAMPAGPPPFRHGQAVRVRDGSFAELEGLFDCAVDEHRVVLLLSLMGRPVRVRVPTLAVEAV